MKYAKGDYVRVIEGLVVGDTYGMIMCGDHDILSGQLVRVKAAIGDDIVFYKLEGDDINLFSEEMLEEASMKQIEKYHEVSVISVESESVNSREAVVIEEEIEEEIDKQFSPEKYVESLKGFVEEFKDAFKDEEMFWKFFYEKATVELHLMLKGIVRKSIALNVNKTIGQQKKKRVSKKG